MNPPEDRHGEWRVSPHGGVPHYFRLTGQALCSHSAAPAELGRMIPAEEIRRRHNVCVACLALLGELQADGEEL